MALDPATTAAYQLLAYIRFFRRQWDLALDQIDRALEVNPSDGESYEIRGAVLMFAGKPVEALPWMETTLRFDRSDLHAIWTLCMEDYFLGRYAEAIAAGDGALARNPARTAQTTMRPFLAAAFAEMGRADDAADERAIVIRLWPFFDAERFAAQFGTQEARDNILAGLRKAGFK